MSAMPKNARGEELVRRAVPPPPSRGTQTDDKAVQSRLKHAETMLAEEQRPDTEVSADSPRKDGAEGASEGE